MLIKTVLVMSLLSLATCEIKRNYTLPYYTNEARGSYKLTDPGKCKTGVKSTKQINGIKLYKPFNRSVTLPATACRRRIDVHSCVYFFFGTRSCTLIHTIYLSTDKRCAVCWHIIYSHWKFTSRK